MNHLHAARGGQGPGVGAVGAGHLVLGAGGRNTGDEVANLD